jgi:hypothetical protein
MRDHTSKLSLVLPNIRSTRYSIAPGNKLAQFVPAPVLDCKTCRDIEVRRRDALDSCRTVNTLLLLLPIWLPLQLEQLPVLVRLRDGSEISATCHVQRENLGPFRAKNGRGRKGGAPFKMTAAKVRLAMAAMGQKETKVTDLCSELAITRQTLYRHVAPDGTLRKDGLKVVEGGKIRYGKKK